MKELSIEEKAKRYDEAIEVAQRFYNNSVAITKKGLEDIFPELQESKDEKIRKSLIILLQYFCKGYRVPGLNFPVSYKDMLTWLEKQAQHTKFRNAIQVGDKVTRNQDGVLVNLSQLQRVAKPAETYKQGEQKPAEWSEADEKMMRYVLGSIDTNISDSNFKNIRIWFESIKDRIQLQLKHEWNTDDEYYRNIILYCLNGDCIGNADKENAIDRLKSLRPQNNSVTEEELEQAKKDAYNDALDKLEYHSGEPTFDDGWSAAIDYIRKKFLRPQNTWKPSEKQIRYLQAIVNDANNAGSESCHIILKELLKQLKTLI